MADGQPPKLNTNLGTHEQDSSSDEHFSDAPEQKAPIDRSKGNSPIPITRVERVDDQPSHGEVPGTPAYDLRTKDAVPDEVEIVPDGLRSRSASRVLPEDRPLTPGGSPIPVTIVERVDDEPAHGEVPGTAAHELRKMDAAPDIVLKAPVTQKRDDEQPPNEFDETTVPPNGLPDGEGEDSNEGMEEDNDDGFGDDFDDFEQGEEGADDDFGDFDDGFQDGADQQDSALHTPVQTARTFAPLPSSVPPILDFNDYSTLIEVQEATQPYVASIFPSLKDLPESTTASEDANSIFLSERSLSLWSQLVAPPPLQPPNWVRSRIRRLFLVSLGVPVDLDEILPASKQKKLILPSMKISADRSPRPSDDRANGAIERLKKGENASSTSVDSSSSKPGRPGSKRRGPPPAPELDISSTTILCSTTEIALNNFTDAELRAHVKRLKALTLQAEEVLQYWTKRVDSAIGDKEAFEGVIENLVKHAKKVRN
ncbi:hypothetical protein EJ05DRAFT_500121 [Pseudovirgaria hyperparasitica]|uniref:Uncharacterized protein n=1 Tax=Pseudovirgaria hyperparasitica TaxID=470096 RepID=A0A6A6W9H8_9PEZI|nr:uncharacterized protein EJ05DRAFT_500121 [Pseudovirgaria hyperparasitica]KAF2758600.1 hypothetical protein EJ05DRAFT_500121 [Pseudovirgaria hyperparasitica]